MKTIPRLIQQKREQIAKLQAQVEVLEELAGEAGVSTAKRGRGRPTGRQRGRVGGARAGRGANQRKVLRVLSNTPTRVRDIAAAARLSPAATNQVLMGLKKTGMVDQTGRGLYKRAGRTAKPLESGASKTRPPRRQRRRKRSGKPKKSRPRKRSKGSPG